MVGRRSVLYLRDQQGFEARKVVFFVGVSQHLCTLNISHASVLVAPITLLLPQFQYPPKCTPYGPGGVLLGIFGGGVPPGSSNHDPISDQKMQFSTPVFKLDLNSIPVFRPSLQADIMLSLLRLERKQTNSSNLFGIRIFHFLSYSFGIETINTFKHSRSSLENHTQFQTKMGKVPGRFQTKTAQKPQPMGRHIPILLI